ncbi:MAG TPA: TMEM175 family protein [Puia sp.]
MIRKLYAARHNPSGGQSIKRNNEIQRIETFSDGVFAFAVTLLIVSLEVPHSFDELIKTMRGFFGFGISFFLLVFIWQEQHRFFRMYGMDDGGTLKLNIALLFLVLFYVYPLKFLFSLSFGDMIYGAGKSLFTITAPQVPALMAIYALGFIAIYFLFFLMYFRARKKSALLGMTPVERFDCGSTMYRMIIMVSVGICSLLTALFLTVGFSGLAGFVYFLIWPAINIFFRYRNKLKKKLFH